MKTLIALLRGINVGGRNKLSMADFQCILMELGASEVKTYLQSGNAVFRMESPDPELLAEAVRSAINDSFSFEPDVLILEEKQFHNALHNNPFKTDAADGKTLHTYFLAKTPIDPNIEKLNHLQTTSEQWELHGAVFYLHTPDGFGRSKLAAGVEKALGVRATARNQTTVAALSKLLDNLR